MNDEKNIKKKVMDAQLRVVKVVKLPALWGKLCQARG